jgi:hypothetical protein
MNNNPTENKEDWMQKKWRPMMALMYMTVCAFDFVVFPILWAIVQFWEVEAVNDAFRQWKPLTLEGAGLFHMAMGAVLGVTAWSRGQEKLAGINNQNSTTPALPAPQPQQFQSFSAPTAQPFNTQPQTVNTVNPVSINQMPDRPQVSSQIMTDSKGRPMPVQPEREEI